MSNIGPGATGTMLQGSGTTKEPTYSTTTYPSTNAINTLLYASSANVMSALATANDGVLITSHTGVPSYLANGTTGQVLTATTGAPPSWSTLSTFTPNSVINVYDDFLNAIGSPTTVLSTQLPWARLGTNSIFAPIAPALTTNPGVVGNQADTTSCGMVANNAGAIKLGAGAISINWVIETPTLSTGTNRYTMYIGLFGAVTTEPTNGVYFVYSDNINSGNWVGRTASASSRSSANSSVAVGTSPYVNLGITVNAAATSVSFFVNGTEISNSPIATNIPTTSLSPACSLLVSAGTMAANSVLLDLMYLTETLTTPR